MTRHYPDLGSISYWLSLLRPIRGTTQIWVVTRHQYEISALVSQSTICRETSDGVAKQLLFSQFRSFEDIYLSRTFKDVRVSIKHFISHSIYVAMRYKKIRNISKVRQMIQRSTKLRGIIYFSFFGTKGLTFFLTL